MPSIFSRKPWTKCCRDCSPSVTISTPASSCSFSQSSVASRLARASSSPCDFHGAHNLLGSASHSGFGKEPAIVVGNSISASPGFWLSVSVPCLMVAVQEQRRPPAPGFGRDADYRENHDRPPLCADAQRLENLDHAGGTRAPLQSHSRQHPGRRTVSLRFPGDQPQQPHPCDR